MSLKKFKKDYCLKFNYSKTSLDYDFILTAEENGTIDSELTVKFQLPIIKVDLNTKKNIEQIRKNLTWFLLLKKGLLDELNPIHQDISDLFC